jgi:threonylcarbamoyladenosine tRNA methylthiotransferase MtaB
VELLREYFPGCALTCDLITGFPGETEDDQQATLEFIRKCGFSDMHIFPYSRRPGTPADKMAGQNTSAVKSRRAREAQKIANEMHREYMLSALGTELVVLFESEAEGGFIGHSDNYLSVFAAGENLRGQMRRVRIVSLDEDLLRGVIID